jgi:hypothetical protein
VNKKEERKGDIQKRTRWSGSEKKMKGKGEARRGSDSKVKQKGEVYRDEVGRR